MTSIDAARTRARGAAALIRVELPQVQTVVHVDERVVVLSVFAAGAEPLRTVVPQDLAPEDLAEAMLVWLRPLFAAN